MPCCAAEEQDFLTAEEEAESWDAGETAQYFESRLNFLRTEPKNFASSVLVPMRQYYHSRLFDMGDGAGQRRLTAEGIAALEDAIRFLRYVEPAPPVRLSQPLTRVAARMLARDVDKQTSGSPSVAGCTVVAHAHGAMGGSSTLAARQVSADVILKARRFRGVIPFESRDSERSETHHAAAVASSVFSMPLNNGTVKCSVDEHLAHLILDDGDGYRPCRRIALTAALTVVGFSSNTPAGTLPPAVGNGLMVIMAESCQMARERLPPSPPPPVDTTVDDLIYAARSAFQVQEAQNFVARKQARRDVKVSKENVARSARASLSQSASTHCVMLG